jgi:hypothetical protein
MMNQFLLSWTIGVGIGCQGGRCKNPTWPDIEAKLEQVRTQGGTVTIDVVNAEEARPQSLQLRSERGNHLLTLGEIGEDYEVRTMTNANDGARVDILGDLWDCKQVSSNFSVVKRAFREFFENGDVSRDLLN